MIRIIVLILILTTSRIAAEVRVSGGEHSDFSRLVFDLGNRREWHIEPAAKGIYLVIEGAEFDLSKAFDLIPKTRITSMTVKGPGRLHIRTACDCPIKTFEIRPGLVVVDFIDAVSEPKSIERLKEAFTLKAHQDPSFQSYEKSLWTKFQTEGLKRNLIVDLKNAATGGNITLSDPSSMQLRATDNLIASHGEAGRNIRVNNETQIAWKAPTSEATPDCFDDSWVAISTWGEEEDLAGQLSRAQENVAAELDRPSKNAVISAVKTYLYLGFSAEALHLLETFEHDSKQHAVLMDVAYIMEGRPGNGDIFSSMSACANMSSFWAILEKGLRQESDVYFKTVLGHFNGLPFHLRTVFGGRILEMAKAGDDLTAINIVKNAIERSATPLDDFSKINVAESYRLLGDGKAAGEIFQGLASTYGPAEAQALIGLVSVKLKDKEVVDKTTIDSLYSLLATYHNTPLKERLTEALAVSHALAGDFRLAFSNLSPTFPSHEDVWKLLVENGNDDDFLLQTIAEEPHARTLSYSTRIKISERLLSQGFADAAKSWRPEAFGSKANEDDRLFAGKVLLGSRNPNAVLEMLANLNSTEATRAKAKAYLQAGNYKEAFNTYRAATGSNDRRKSSGGGQPQAVGETSDVEFQKWIDPAELETRLRGSNSGSMLLDGTSLAGARALLDGSGNLRDETMGILRNSSGNED